MVEAIEENFIPVLVYNNQQQDAALLKSFNEPSWNNPVVRFLDSTGKDVITRRDNVWTTGALAERMAQALTQAKRPVPNYLQAVIDGWQKKFQQASFAML